MLNILAVDDEAGVLKIIANTFQDYNITTETSSLKALEILEMKKFDIFIVDYQMPQVNGIELLEEIKRIYYDKQYVSILATAYGTIHLFKSEFVQGLFRYYIEKPFNIDFLKDTIKRAITTLERIRTGEEQKISIS